MYLSWQKKRGNMPEYIENRGFTNNLKGKKLNTVSHQLNKKLYSQVWRKQDSIIKPYMPRHMGM